MFTSAATVSSDAPLGSKHPDPLSAEDKPLASDNRPAATSQTVPSSSGPNPPLHGSSDKNADQIPDKPCTSNNGAPSDAASSDTNVSKSHTGQRDRNDEGTDVDCPQDTAETPVSKGSICHV
jgi:hypothetical protein